MLKWLAGLFGRRDEAEMRRFEQMRRRFKISEQVKIDPLAAGRHNMDHAIVVGRGASDVLQERTERMLAICSAITDERAKPDLTPPVVEEKIEVVVSVPTATTTAV